MSSPEDHDHPLCPGCCEAQALITRVDAEMDAEGEPDPFVVMQTLPALLESALACVVIAREGAAQSDVKLGDALRLLSVAASHAEALRARAGELRRKWA